MKKIKGFTLVELMVIVGLISLMLVLVLSSISRSRIKARDNVRVADIQTIRLALEEYRARCGVFPDELSVTANNGRRGDCEGGAFSFGDIIGEIPTAPERSTSSQLPSTTVSSASIVNGYFYAGLSTSIGGPCYDYHLGVELEFAENNGRDGSGFLDEDHDFEDGEGQYDSRCGASPDFGSNNAETDDLNGLYDFRSTNSN